MKTERATGLEMALTAKEAKVDTFQHLNELIEAGYGDIPQTQIPADWRTKPAPKLFYPQTEHGEQLRVPQRRRKRRTYAELRADRA